MLHFALFTFLIYILPVFIMIIHRELEPWILQHPKELLCVKQTMDTNYWLKLYCFHFPNVCFVFGDNYCPLVWICMKKAWSLNHAILRNQTQANPSKSSKTLQDHKWHYQTIFFLLVIGLYLTLNFLLDVGFFWFFFFALLGIVSNLDKIVTCNLTNTLSWILKLYC